MVWNSSLLNNPLIWGSHPALQMESVDSNYIKKAILGKGLF